MGVTAAAERGSVGAGCECDVDRRARGSWEVKITGEDASNYESEHK